MDKQEELTATYPVLYYQGNKPPEGMVKVEYNWSYSGPPIAAKNIPRSGVSVVYLVRASDIYRLLDRWNSQHSNYRYSA